METRIKERLTGALILVALMVIVVPEFLSGHSPGSSADAVPAARPASEGPPLVTYHMPLDGAADSSAGQAALNVQPSQSADHLPAPAPTIAEAPPVETAPPVLPLPTEAPQVSQPAPEPEKKAEEKRPAEEKKPVDMKPKAAAKAPEAKAPAVAGKGWFVQLGVFSKRENAEQLVKQAARKGHTAQISGSGTTWRVRVGPLSDRAAAQALKKRLAAEGLAANVVAP